MSSRSVERIMIQENTKDTEKYAAPTMHVETDICFKIIGNDEQVFHGQSETLSTKDLSFFTNHLLKAGMLLQMTMAAKQLNSPSLQTMVEVVSIKSIDGSNSCYQYHIDGDIKDIAIGM